MEQDSAYNSPQSVQLSASSLSPSTSKPVEYQPITCPCCNKSYVNPRVLPCLHTLCFACLETNSCKIKKKISCPKCKVDFCLPENGVNGLVPDFGTLSFMRSMQGNACCSSCKALDVPAIAKCIDCDHLLCRCCADAHIFMYVFQKHRVVEFPVDLPIGPDAIQPKCDDGFLNCLIHTSNQLDNFCLPCNIPVCSDCITGSHAGHRVDSLDQIGDAMVTLLNIAMEETKNNMSKIVLSLKNAKKVESYLMVQYMEISRKIEDQYALLSNVLNKCKLQQFSLLETMCTNAKAAIHNYVNVSQDSMEKATKAIDFHSRLSKYSSVGQILMFKKMLEVKNTSLEQPKNIGCSLRFVAEPCDYSALFLRAFGEVTIQLNPGDDSYLMNDFPSNTALMKTSPRATGHLDLLSESAKREDSYLSRFLSSTSLMKPFSRQVITYSHKFGSYGSLTGQFSEPNGVTINSSGDIIIADTNNNRVQLFDKLGNYRFHFGEVSTSRSCGSLLFPNRVAVMEKTGDIVVTERSPTHQVQIYNPYGQFVRKFGANILKHPRAVAVDAQGRIIVVECKVMRVFIFFQSGEVLNKFTCTQTLQFPNGVAVNDRNLIFISDNRIHCVVVYDYSGCLVRTIGHEGIINYPIAVMLDRKGKVYVADNHNNFNLTVFSEEGQFIAAYESKVKHAHCYDAEISPLDGSVALSSKDYVVYIYNTK